MAKRITKRGLRNVPNERGFNSNIFPHLIRYLYIPETGNIRRFYLEFKVNEYNIIEISFYQKNKGDEKTKYRLRDRKIKGSNRESYDRGLFLVFNKIVELCLETFTNNCCFVFCGANDVNSKKESNDRFSTYTRYISRQIPKFEQEWNIAGSYYLNTFIFYHRDNYKFKEEVPKFFDSYNDKIQELLDKGEI